MDHLLKRVVWERIRAHESETFTQILGGEFSYLVRGESHLELSCTAVAASRGTPDLPRR